MCISINKYNIYHIKILIHISSCDCVCVCVAVVFSERCEAWPYSSRSGMASHCNTTRETAAGGQNHLSSSSNFCLCWKYIEETNWLTVWFIRQVLLYQSKTSYMNKTVPTAALLFVYVERAHELPVSMTQVASLKYLICNDINGETEILLFFRFFSWEKDPSDLACSPLEF